MMDLNQLYTVLFCLWFLSGAIGIWCCAGCGVAGFARTLNREGRACGRDDGFSFTVGARRQIEGPGEDAGKGLLRIEAILQADIVDR